MSLGYIWERLKNKGSYAEWNKDVNSAKIKQRHGIARRQKQATRAN